MTFVLGNTYQSLIIAKILISREGTKFHSFDELFQSGLRFKADQIFSNFMNLSGKPDIANKSELSFINHHTDIPEGYALISSCNLIHFNFYHMENLDINDFFYILPDKICPFFEKFSLSLASPFYDALQSNFDRTFETGIRHFWKNQFEEQKLAEVKRNADFVAGEKYFLNLDDVHGVFYILLVGFFASVFVFFVEIRRDLQLKNNFRKIQRCVAKCRHST